MSEGEKLYQLRCRVCHLPSEKEKLSHYGRPDFVRSHGNPEELSEQDFRKIVEYLQASE